jgi:hypothetical protein
VDRLVGFSSRLAVDIGPMGCCFSSRFAADTLVITIGGCFSSRFAVDKLVDTIMGCCTSRFPVDKLFITIVRGFILSGRRESLDGTRRRLGKVRQCHDA